MRSFSRRRRRERKNRSARIRAKPITETGTAMAIFVVFDGPPEKAVESLAAKVVSEDEDEAEIVVVVGVDVTEDEFKLDSAVQAVCVDDNGG